MTTHRRSTRFSPARVVGLTLAALGLSAAPAAAGDAAAAPASRSPRTTTAPALPNAQPIPARTVELITTVTLPARTESARMWIPVPLQSPVQDVLALTVQAPPGWSIEQEPLHGNRFVYAETPPADTAVTLQWTAVVRRRRWTEPEPEDTTPAQVQHYLRPTALVPVGGAVLGPRTDAALAGTDADTTVRARGLFDFVRTEMVYAKDTTGWGRGDALYACDAKRGNCTDFHSLFNGMARTAGIPARFTMGMSLPPARQGEIGGYHCWTAYWHEGRGWVPADISESNRHPERPAEQYFAQLDEHRVAIGRGRDVVLAPPQAGPPINYVWNPYVEIAGRSVEIAATRRTYRDLGAVDVAARLATGE